MRNQYLGTALHVMHAQAQQRGGTQKPSIRVRRTTALAAPSEDARSDSAMSKKLRPSSVAAPASPASDRGPGDTAGCSAPSAGGPS